MALIKNVIQEIGQHTNMMPRESDNTLPMVKIENGSVLVRSLIYFTHLIPKQGTVITFPKYIAIYNLTEKKFMTLKKFNLELSNLSPQPWIHNRPTFTNAEEIIPEFNRIWSLYDILIPSYKNQSDPVSNDIKKAAKTYEIFLSATPKNPCSLFTSISAEIF